MISNNKEQEEYVEMIFNPRNVALNTPSTSDRKKETVVNANEIRPLISPDPKQMLSDINSIEVDPVQPCEDKKLKNKTSARLSEIDEILNINIYNSTTTEKNGPSCFRIYYREIICYICYTVAVIVSLILILSIVFLHHCMHTMHDSKGVSNSKL
ncbi:hypothetical protein NEMIN01_1543 [Nematocida minor]|uniref:uncharacterized protein n=1 Tax=Nematocida minor TaxID=1912983 RepID=UPI00221F8216|nr:uncharacterized protein NEMIN01_1543 [Nematocida minor]KAI5191517.1 hypothetical protein NEMIN01_1543 [Nematocida minor]